jgi:glycosyltransferase involved in cell wall biosynthesis
MKSCDPLVTVILPVFNGRKTLFAAVNSICQQTYENWELLVLDDGSTDGSLATASSFRDDRVIPVVRSNGQGLTARLNQGIDLAKGRYIARMDADDIAFPERLARQVAYLESHPVVDLLGTRAVVFRDDGSIVGLLPFSGTHDAICAHPWNNIPLPHPTWMGRREWFCKHRYHVPEYHRAEDQELLLRAHDSSRYACLPDVLLAYRQGGFSLKRTLTGRVGLLRAQWRYFLSHLDGISIIQSIGIITGKVIVDLAASFPGAYNLYFMRMSEQPDKQSLQILSRLLADYLILK